MAGSVPEIQIQVNSKKGGNSIHPVEPARTSAGGGPPVVYREIKHFKKWFPWLIPSFVIANVVTFFVTMYVNNCPHNSVSCVAGFLGRFSFQPFSENPLLGPSSNTLEKMGALDVNKVVHGHEGWRLITCMWLHGGVFHLLANMLSLIVIGIRLEREFGFVRIGLLYIIAGLGGSLFSALFIKSNISVGASGALFGLLGSMLSELIINWTIYANKLAVLVTLVVIIVINLAVGILPHVDNFAHIGGFMSGFLLGFVFLIRPQFGWVSQRYASSGYSSTSAKPKFKVYQMVLWVISLVLLIIGFTSGLVMLLRGVDLNDHCSWCHYMSCVPTSRWSCNSEPVSCMSEQTDNQLTLTCSNSNKTRSYSLSNPSTSKIQGLCSQLCR
ncbi:RHOMBOID-like protein 1 [Nicotiana tabacum]|uniref:RHOMBOID-like protein n=2 Tax=Nicotiana TaxID=4085 RepID=A0A1S4A659_TOBAC|nr:PREDICTED: inactive rhomboid protein 1-like [Nicotiana sylvestris]XP_016472084.1 PREDICTED: RHOMBOID-like protein 1 [Nicotiana tabacum]